MSRTHLPVVAQDGGSPGDVTLIAGVEPDADRHKPLGQLELGQWYWVSPEVEEPAEPEDDGDGEPLDAGADDEVEQEWLGCVMHIGSNYLEINAPQGSCYRTARIHFDEFWKRLRYEPNAEAVIRAQIAHHQGEVQRLLVKVHELTKQLGIPSVGALRGPSNKSPGTTGTDLVTLSGQIDVNAYKRALVKAKEETLPELFDSIRKENEELARWMMATTMPLKAQIGPMEETIEQVDGRIFSVSLYAGLTEDVVRCADGKPAGVHERLRVMQRRLFMDEESLLSYRAGGLDLGSLEEFDAWLAKPANRDRILPFPRTLVAMRVRRNEKERDNFGDLRQALINIEIAQEDSYTFLYIRNGEQLWRLSCEMDFGAMLFPDRTMFDPLEPKMVKMWGSSRVEKMISVSEYEEMLAEYRECEARSKAWKKANPKAHHFDNPYRPDWSSLRDWTPFDQSSVYYDQALADIERRVKEYNRVALIIQGLFDRSPVLHPHPPVQTWTAEGFDRAIELVYDGAHVLHHGEPPDFEAYRQACNASLCAGSITAGQFYFWTLREGERESRRLDGDWRNRSTYRPKTFQPYGNPGPGLVDRISQWRPRAREALFVWDRERQRQARYGCGDELLRTTLAVPASALLNVSAYQPGDFKQFFVDARTREQYLKWAPLLLTAEDYHGGALKVGEHDCTRPRRRGRG